MMFVPSLGKFDVQETLKESLSRYVAEGAKGGVVLVGGKK